MNQLAVSSTMIVKAVKKLLYASTEISPVDQKLCLITPTVYHESSTLNPEPETQNPKPKTQPLKPSTLLSLTGER